MPKYSREFDSRLSRCSGMKDYHLHVLIVERRLWNLRDGTLVSRIISLSSRPMSLILPSSPLDTTGNLRTVFMRYLNPRIEWAMLLICYAREALILSGSIVGATVLHFDYVRYIFRLATMLKVWEELRYSIYNKVRQGGDVEKPHRGILGWSIQSSLLIVFQKRYRPINSSLKMPSSSRTIWDRIRRNGQPILIGVFSTMTLVEDYRLLSWHTRNQQLKELFLQRNAIRYYRRWILFQHWSGMTPLLEQRSIMS